MFRKIFFACLSALIVVHSVSAEEYAFREALEPFVNDGKLAGIMTIVADRENVLQVDSMGYRDLETKEPIDMDSTFWIASQTKTFTAVAAMMLVEEGKLSLTEPITTYLPELADLRVVKEKDDNHTLLVPPEQPITLTHLLSHTSGLPGKTVLDGDTVPLRWTLRVCSITPLQVQPNEKHIYSNLGFAIVGCLIEKVTGLPYDVFIHRRILAPLEMKNTTFWPTPDQLENSVRLYRPNTETKKLEPCNFGMFYPLDNRQKRVAMPGGGLFSTGADLVKFYQMLLAEGSYKGKRLLKPESVRELWSPHEGNPLPHYQFAVAVEGKAYGHDGATGSRSRVHREKDRVFLFVTQLNDEEGGNEARRAFNRVFMK